MAHPHRCILIHRALTLAGGGATHRAPPPGKGASARQPDPAQTRLDPGQGADQPDLPRDPHADARTQAEHGLRGSGLPEHRRVLEAEARHHDDHGRRSAPAPAPSATSRPGMPDALDAARAATASPRRWPSSACSMSSSPRSTATTWTMAAPTTSPRPSARIRAAAPDDHDRDPDARLPAQGGRARDRGRRPGPTCSTTTWRPCRGSIPTIRPGARYYHSLRLLDRVKQLDPTHLHQVRPHGRPGRGPGTRCCR